MKVGFEFVDKTLVCFTTQNESYWQQLLCATFYLPLRGGFLINVGVICDRSNESY